MSESKKRATVKGNLMARRVQRRRVLRLARQATVGFVLRFQGESVEEYPRIIGSGVIVDVRGIVLTARHVVLDMDSAIRREQQLGRIVEPRILIYEHTQVSMSLGEDGRQQQTSLTYTETPIVGPPQINRTHDIGVVQIDARGLKNMRLDVSYAPEEGDPVATCGWPYGTELHGGLPPLSSFLIGTISAVLPHSSTDPLYRQHYLTQLPVNPGNSGGGAFDPDSGELFGIVSSRWAPSGIPSGLSIVVPACHAADLVGDAAGAAAT